MGWERVHDEELRKKLLGRWYGVPDLKLERRVSEQYTHAVFCDVLLNPKTKQECVSTNHTYKSETIEIHIEKGEQVTVTFPEKSDGILICNACQDRYEP